MIIETIVTVLVAILKGIGSLFGVFSMPGWWSDVSSGIQWTAEKAGGFSQWIPMIVFVHAVGLVLAAYAVAIGIKAVRIGLSLFTGGGGSAA